MVVGVPLLALLVVFLAGSLPLPWKESWTPVLPIGLVGLHLLCLAERAMFCMTHGLSWADPQTVVREGRFQTTSTSAIAESQAAWSWLTQMLGQPGGGSSPFVASFPSWLLGLHAVVLIAVSGIALLAVAHYQRQASVERTICLTWAIVALLWAGVHDGPLAPSALVSLIFLLGLLYGGPAADLVSVFSLLALPLSFWLTAERGLGALVVQTLGTFLFLLVPLLWERARTEGEPIWKAGALGGVLLLFALPWLQVQLEPRLGEPPYTQGTIRYRSFTLLPGGQIVVVGPPGLKEPENSPLRIVAKLYGQRLVVYRAELHETIRVGDLCDRLGLDATRYPVIWKRSPVCVTMTGNFPKPFPKLLSELVMGYHFQENEGVSTLTMTLQGSAGWRGAFDALPGFCIVTEAQMTRELPVDFTGWQPGAGLGKWEPGPKKGKGPAQGARPQGGSSPATP